MEEILLNQFSRYLFSMVSAAEGQLIKNTGPGKRQAKTGQKSKDFGEHRPESNSCPLHSVPRWPWSTCQGPYEPASSPVPPGTSSFPMQKTRFDLKHFKSLGSLRVVSCANSGGGVRHHGTIWGG